jgi:hypothetical protein
MIVMQYQPGENNILKEEAIPSYDNINNLVMMYLA